MQRKMCFECNEPGHVKRACPIYIERGIAKPCGYCKKAGHKFQECPRLLAKQEQRRAEIQSFQEKCEFVPLTNLPLPLPLPPLPLPLPLPPSSTFAAKVKYGGGELSVFRECEEANQVKKELVQRKHAKRIKMIKDQAEAKEEWKKMQNEMHLKKMIEIRGPYWYMWTEETTDEYNPRVGIDLRDLAQRLRYDKDHADEKREDEERVLEEESETRYAKEKEEEDNYNKCNMRPEEYERYKEDRLFDLYDEISGDYLCAMTSYVLSAPNEYADECMRSGCMQDWKTKPIENARRNQELRRIL